MSFTFTFVSHGRSHLAPSSFSPLSTVARRGQQCFHLSSSSLRGHVLHYSKTAPLASRSLSNSASSLRMAQMVEGYSPLRLLLIGSPVSLFLFVCEKNKKRSMGVQKRQVAHLRWAVFMDPFVIITFFGSFHVYLNERCFREGALSLLLTHLLTTPHDFNTA